jgi:pilus assembly protein CpaC
MSGPDIRTVNERVLPVGLKSIVRIGQRARVAIVVSILALVALGVPQVVAQSVAPTGDKQIIIQSSGSPLTEIALGAPSDTPRMLKLAIGRAQLVRLPVDVKDIIVSSSAVADVVVKSPRLVYMLGQQSGSTSVIMLDAAANIIYNMNIVVAQELSTLQAMLKTVLPDESISVTSVQGNILMTGKVRTSYAASYARDLARRFVTSDEQIINRIQVLAEQQVMLRVRVAEVRRSVTKTLGLSGSIGQADNVVGNSTTFLTPLTGTGVVGPQGTGTIKFGLFAGNPFRNLALALDALETEGLVRTLAEPNLTSLSGEHATFLAGGEIPVPAGLDRNGNLTIRFRDFGVELDFTPTVLDTGRINLKVRTSVSEVDTSNSVVIQGVSIPGFRTRRAQTTVEMASGGGLVIGGLLQNDLSNSQSGFPGLVDIPIIGALFRSTSFTKAESELVVTVSAYLVRPVAEQALVLPTDGFAASSDADMYLLGRLHAHYGRKGTKPPKGKPKGPVGFVME